LGLEVEELRAAKRVIKYFVLDEIIKQQSLTKNKRYYTLYIKKPTPYRPELAQRMDRGIALPFLDLGARTRWVVSITPRPFSAGNTLYLLYKRLGGPHGLSEGVLKILPPPGFIPRTVQPVASRYTD
jgi:hypothetical protein